MSMATVWRQGAALISLMVAGCTAQVEHLDASPDVLETVDTAVLMAANCASDLDALTSLSPVAAWSALQAQVSPDRSAPVPGTDGLEERLRVEVARRLQAVLDSRTAVDRLVPHTGEWSWPRDGSSVAAHARSLAVSLCRTRDVAQTLARRKGPLDPEAISHVLSADGARD